MAPFIETPPGPGVDRGRLPPKNTAAVVARPAGDAARQVMPLETTTKWCLAAESGRKKNRNSASEKNL
jgi:hypothetical protein